VFLCPSSRCFHRLHSQELVDFSLDEIHKLIVGFGIQRKSDQVLAEETQQNLELIQEARADWERMIKSPKSVSVDVQ